MQRFRVFQKFQVLLILNVDFLKAIFGSVLK